MGTLIPLGPELAAMRDRLGRIDRSRPHTGPVLKVEVRYPVLTLLEPSDAARLVCGPCFGSGVRFADAPPTDPPADQWACPTCGGTGLRCPVCCGTRWVRTPVQAGGPAKVEDLIQRCPACPTAPAEHETIVRFIAACREAAGVPV